MCVCVCARARACVRACVRVCVWLRMYFRLADERLVARAPALDRAQNWPDTKDSSSIPLLRDYLPCSDVRTTCLPNLGKWAVKASFSFAFFDHQLKPSVSAVYTHIKHRGKKMKKKKKKKKGAWGWGVDDLLPVNFEEHVDLRLHRFSVTSKF